MNKQLRVTRKVELVETHNLALSLDRLTKSTMPSNAWKRALYHAVTMTYTGSHEFQEKLRIALELP